jgi:glycosyltransferase involved in cell wall biosynthesis
VKVLFLTNIPSPYRIDFFEELGKLCDLTVLFEREDAKDRENSWLKTDFTNFKYSFLKSIKIGNDSAFCPSILKYIKGNQYDVIIIGIYSTPTGLLAIEYMSRKKIPFLLNSDGGLIKNDDGLKRKFKSHFIRPASGYLSTGENTNRYLAHYGAKKEKMFIYPFTSLKNEDILNEVLSQEQKKELKKKLGITQSKVILSVGRFIPLKGFDILLKSCEKLDDDIGVYIIGGEPTQQYIDIKNELGLNNVHFVDFKDKTELEDYYRAADLFVLPTRSDIWGLVINEAMANGLPVITTDRCVAGLELIQDGENGFIVPVDDVQALTDKINDILSDDRMRENMANNNLAQIRSYTIENMAKKHMEIFTKIRG